jgi:hypothetical protein
MKQIAYTLLLIITLASCSREDRSEIEPQAEIPARTYLISNVFVTNYDYLPGGYDCRIWSDGEPVYTGELWGSNNIFCEPYIVTKNNIEIDILTTGTLLDTIELDLDTCTSGQMIDYGVDHVLLLSFSEQE